MRTVPPLVEALARYEAAGVKVARVVVRGGAVQDIVAPAGVAVLVVDYDIDGSDVTELDQDEDGDDCAVVIYSAGKGWHTLEWVQS